VPIIQPQRARDWKGTIKHFCSLEAGSESEEEVRGAHLIPTSNITETVQSLLASAGLGARLAVIPEGPQVIPCLP
jgi:hypothetical protein